MKNKSGVIYFTTILSGLVFYSVNRTTFLYNKTEGNVLEKITKATDLLLKEITEKPFFIGTDKNSLIGGAIGFTLIWLIFLYKAFDSKNYMHKKEHGSAEWGTKRDANKYKDLKNQDNNILLSDTEAISMSSKTNNFETERNKNVTVIGGAGSGKTQGYVKPNLLQQHSSYVFTDPKGTLLPDSGKSFERAGYEIRALNTINFKKSMHYNPLYYIRSEKDILKVVNVIMENTKGKGDKSGEDFWVKAEKLFYQAIIGYLHYEAPESEKNIGTMIDLMDLCDVKENDEEYKNPLDILFEELEEKSPLSFPVKQYKKFKKAAGKTMSSILISCGARLSPFDMNELREITSYDELKLDEIGDRKTALYVIMSDTDDTFSFLIAMMFYQMFNLLCDKADDEYGGRLPFHVRCVLDEFANIGKIPNFEKLISTIRSREISATIILQSLSQLNSLYKDDADTIIDCCDSLLFLGGKSTKTTKSISEMIGKTTIDNVNVNETKGQNGSYSLNNQIIGRDLIDPAEIGKLKRTECLVLITGEKPFKSKKYDLKKHIRYTELADSDEKNIYNNDFREKEKEAEIKFISSIETIQEIEIDEKELEKSDTTLTELNALL